MKKLFIIFFAVLLIFTNGCSKPLWKDISSSQLQTTNTSQTSSYYENNKSFTFRKAFSDFALASKVAQVLNKKIDDETSEKELANITEFNIINYNDENGQNYDCYDLTGIGYLKGLTEFGCYKNSVTQIPAEIKNLKNLKVLNLGKAYSLTKLPSEIGELQSLKELGLFLTDIKHLPTEIGKLRNLEKLSVGASENLMELPTQIGNLTNLEYLDIHSTKINTIPESICNLTNLKYLDMSYLGLKSLPDNIGNLTNLEVLNLFSNDLRHLPNSMSEMKKLASINIYNNYNLSEDYKNILKKDLWQK